MSKEFRVSIDSINSLGQGVAQYESLPVYIDDVLPGEEVLARELTRKSSYIIAKLIKHYKTHPERVEPSCPHFKDCGACQLMHLGYDSQLKYKSTKVLKALKEQNLDFTSDQLEVAPSITQWFYRHRMIAYYESESNCLGFLKPRSNEGVEIKSCKVQDPLSQSLFTEIQSYLNKTGPLSGLRAVAIRTTTLQEASILLIADQRRDELELLAQALSRPEISIFYMKHDRGSNRLFSGSIEPMSGPISINEDFLGLKIQIPPRAFFQVNIKAAKQMYHYVIELLRERLSVGSSIMEVYCGLGLISLLLAKEGFNTSGIEIHPEAIHWAKKNAEALKIDHASFWAQDAKEVELEKGKWETLICNPPRKGCSEAFLKTLIDCECRYIVYISCNPQTLARDCKILENAGIKISSVRTFDLFPQTIHIESVAFLERT